jgi:ferredoxin
LAEFNEWAASDDAFIALPSAFIIHNFSGRCFAMKRTKPFKGITRSTRAFLKEARATPNYSWLDWLHGYLYGRWIYQYISIGTGEHWLVRTFGPLANRMIELFQKIPERKTDSQNRVSFADTYHAKVVSLDSAKKLVTVNQEISLTNLEQVVPYARARDIVLHNPDHIVVLDCPCRAARANPCTPIDVCLVVGEPFASFVLEHQGNRARQITPAEAAEILEAEHERGHVHHAFFKDAMLGRFYAICNCCSCCCGAMQAQRNGVPMLASSGFVSVVDDLQCSGCGLCADVCQFNAIEINDGVAQINTAACMGCGVCADHCTCEAISLKQDASRGEPLEIERLMAASLN